VKRVSAILEPGLQSASAATSSENDLDRFAAKRSARRVLPLRMSMARWVTIGLIFLAALTAVFATTQSGTSLFLFDTALLAAMGAIALNLLMGTAGQVSLGNAAFLAVGAFSSVIFMREGIPFPFDTILAMLVTGVAGALVAIPALRLRGVYVALSTLALQFIVIFITQEYQAHALASVGYLTLPQFASFGITGGERYWAILLFAVLALVIIFVAAITQKRAGRAWRLIRDHQEAAPLFGVAVNKYKIFAFAISSAIIGVEGSLTVHFTGTATFDQFSLALAIQYVVMVMIGGIDSIGGVVVGAALLTVLPTLTSTVVSHVASPQFASSQGGAVSEMIYGGLLVLVVVAMPEGLAGLAKHVFASALLRIKRPKDMPGAGTLPPIPANSTQ
jgi:branched-chain amino acid transport system permease protein